MANTVVFIDNIGRTVLGEEVVRGTSTLTVKNPVVVHVVPNQQNGQLQVQLIPMFLTELIDTETRLDGTLFEYNLNVITLATVKIDTRLLSQYAQVFTPQPTVVPSEGQPIVKLFDEED